MMILTGKDMIFNFAGSLPPNLADFSAAVWFFGVNFCFPLELSSALQPEVFASLGEFDD